LREREGGEVRRVREGIRSVNPGFGFLISKLYFYEFVGKINDIL
jgi:hypothetical protein